MTIVRGAALRLDAPGRPPELAIVPGRAARGAADRGDARSGAARADPPRAGEPRALQAIELVRLGAARVSRTRPRQSPGAASSQILVEEQRHRCSSTSRGSTKRSASRSGDHGAVTGHFWNKLDHLATPLEFVCAMGLPFENANLDFAGEYARAARACGDVATADVLDRVHADEIGHVHFGYVWLAQRFAGDREPWLAYLDHVQFPLGPRRARGATFDREAPASEAGFDAADLHREPRGDRSEAPERRAAMRGRSTISHFRPDRDPS